MPRRIGSGLLLTFLIASAGQTDEPTPAERGKKALFTRPFTAAMWKTDAYGEVWRQWGVKARPTDYTSAFMDRYGTHPAPYDNGGLPMGLRSGSNFLGKGLTIDCMLCHAGAIFGQSYIGLGNSSLDLQAFFEDLSKA